MVSSIDKLNMFTQTPAIQGIGAVKSGSTQATGGETSSNNPFAATKSNTVGINTNIGVGDTSYVSNQLGKSGIGRTLAFA